MDAALVELRRAYELAPSYKLLFNIGQVHLQKSDYASALDSFERYLAQGGDKIARKRRREIEALVEKLRQRVAEVTRDRGRRRRRSSGRRFAARNDAARRAAGGQRRASQDFRASTRPRARGEAHRSCGCRKPDG